MVTGSVPGLLTLNSSETWLTADVEATRAIFGGGTNMEGLAVLLQISKPAKGPNGRFLGTSYPPKPRTQLPERVAKPENKQKGRAKTADSCQPALVFARKSLSCNLNLGRFGSGSCQMCRLANQFAYLPASFAGGYFALSDPFVRHKPSPGIVVVALAIGQATSPLCLPADFLCTGCTGGPKSE